MSILESAPDHAVYSLYGEDAVFVGLGLIYGDIAIMTRAGPGFKLPLPSG